MEKKALIVVDMQPNFKAATDEKTVKNVIKEVKHAISKNYPIVILEFMYFGKTDKRIREAVKGYERCVVKKKNFDDGSPEVIKGLGKNLAKTYRVCGVNTTACVQSTAIGLATADKLVNPKIEVKLSACNSSIFFKNITTKEGCKRVLFKQHKNIKVV